MKMSYVIILTKGSTFAPVPLSCNTNSKREPGVCSSPILFLFLIFHHLAPHIWSVICFIYTFHNTCSYHFWERGCLARMNMIFSLKVCPSSPYESRHEKSPDTS